jgi:uncharacterized protein with HEPN domain
MPRDMDSMVDIVDAARLAVSYLGGVSKQAFLDNTQLQDAVIRRLEIIGEAARRISPETREAYVAIAWPEMIGMRNLMIHGYDDIDLEIIWDTVKSDLPGLIEQLEVILGPEAF